MSDTDLCYLTIAEAAGLISTGKVSPVELTEAHLRRIERIDGKLNTFLTVTAEMARAEAREAEREIAAGRCRGPLHGVPYSLKDLYATKGIRTTGGTKILADWVPDYDSAVAERLESAGGILLGKTNMHEFAMGATSINPHYGAARNAWNPEHISGGSSGGAASGVAAGLGHLGMGSETGNSIRRPAAFCGVTGLKPTYGRVSRHGMLPAAWSLDHAGPLTRSAGDAAIVLQALAGRDRRDAATSQVPVPDYSAGLGEPVSGIKAGVPRRFLSDLSGEADVGFAEVLATLGRAGVSIVDLALPSGAYAATVSSAIMLSEAASYHADWVRDRPADYGRDVLTRLWVGLAITAQEYTDAQRFRRLIAGEMLAEMRSEGVDLIIAPTIPAPATPIAGGAAALGDEPYSVGDSFFNLHRLFSLVGWPVVSIPCGFGSSGLPLAVQIAGRPFDEPRILRLAHAYEQMTDWHLRRPSLG